MQLTTVQAALCSIVCCSHGLSVTWCGWSLISSAWNDVLVDMALMLMIVLVLVQVLLLLLLLQAFRELPVLGGRSALH